MNMAASKYNTETEYLKDCYFVRINPGNKTPLDWGWGYPESKPENPPLEENHKHFAGSEADEWLREWHNWWGVLDHHDRNLIILDIDCYKPEFPDEHIDCDLSNSMNVREWLSNHKVVASIFAFNLMGTNILRISS